MSNKMEYIAQVEKIIKATKAIKTDTKGGEHASQNILEFLENELQAAKDLDE